MLIIVYGRPAPQGSKKFVGRAANGRGILVESSKHLPTWREDVRQTALRCVDGAPPLDGPLVARMVFTVAKPASAPKRRRTFPSTRPDVSKLCRSTEDALTDAGVIADDARIVGYERLWKTYPNEDPEALAAPGVRIEIKPLNVAAYGGIPWTK